MSVAVHFGFSEEQFTWFFQGVLFVLAAMCVLLTLSKAKQAGQTLHSRWLVPLAVYTVEQSITYTIENVYRLFNLTQPVLVTIIMDIMDDISVIAFLWALVALWKIIRNAPDSLRSPWLNADETPEGVWPPAPKVR